MKGDNVQTTFLSTLVERHWGLEHVVPNQILQRYGNRTVLSIQSDQGNFVVKAYRDESALGLNRPVTTEIDQRLGIYEYLAGQDFGRAPSLLVTSTGNRFVRSGGATVFILKYIEGTRPSATPESWAELGLMATQLNTYTDFPISYGIPVAGTIAELMRKAERYSFGNEYVRLVSTLEILADQPARLIHGEINTANSVLSSDGQIFLIDWDQAGMGPWVLEPGYPLITTFLSDDLVFDARAAAAFYGSWTAGETMTAERRDLVFTAALLHALRYLEFGDPIRRWARIQFALAQKDELLSVLDAS